MDRLICALAFVLLLPFLQMQEKCGASQGWHCGRANLVTIQDTTLFFASVWDRVPSPFQVPSSHGETQWNSLYLDSAWSSHSYCQHLETEPVGG